MKKILGIDTGGTYTDLVIIESSTRNVLAKYKTFTDRTDLCGSIEKGFEQLPEEYFKDISMVSLSTTLATNAIVENHGCKTGLILIGERPNGKLSSDQTALVKGKYDIKGRVKENLDIVEIETVVESFRGKVDAMAVSGYASVRNPKHEIYVKSVIEQKLGVPVACAHELTSLLGFYDRTVTVVLDAKLIPMLCELIDDVKSVMADNRIDAPLMVVKGDGSLMTEAVARSRPIDTILSGPASSIIGGTWLSGEDDVFVVDMGGTTTDIANVAGGLPKIRDEGAKVGGWFTHVRAAEVFTLGLGGDSRIYIDSSGSIRIGPEKSIPLTMAADRYPELKDEMRHIYECGSYKNFRFHDHEAYLLIRKHEKLTYSDDEKILIEILRKGPCTKDYLKNHINMNKLQKLLDGLTQEGVVARISLTPTDILHVTGEFKMWDEEIADIALSIVTEKYGWKRKWFIEEVKRLITEKLDRTAIEAALYFDHHEVDMQPGSTYDYFINDLFFRNTSSVLQVRYRLPKKIVGIGAPAAAWLSDMGKKLGTSVMIPEHAEVANAVGAAVGRDIEEVEILIRLDSVTGKYVIFSPVDRVSREDLGSATGYAVEIGKKCIRQMSEGRMYDVETEENDLEFTDETNGRKIFIERIVKLTARYIHEES